MGGVKFLVVQLAAFGQMTSGPSPSAWAELREAQRLVVEEDRDTSLIPTIDIGDAFDIHPTNKREVGRRLALAATESGAARRGTGITVSIVGDRADLRLNRRYRLLGGVTAPAGFELCRADGRCRYANAACSLPIIFRSDGKKGKSNCDIFGQTRRWSACSTRQMCRCRRFACR